MESVWRIEMLGGLQVVGRDRIVTRFRTRKTACLLAYLACRLDRAHPRELLIETLWPESDPDLSRQSLRQALASLRRQMEPPGTAPGRVFLSDRFSVRLNPAAVTTDVDSYRALLQQAERAAVPADRRGFLEQAVEAYRGELLPGFYEDWVLREQDFLFQSYVTAIQELVESLEAAGECPRAARFVEQALLLYPACEEFQRMLSRLPVPTGAAAQEERERAPEPFASMTPRGNLPPALTRFFGREEEMARLRARLRDPSVRLVTLSGPGGSGKTRLALEAARMLSGEFRGAVWFVPLASLSDPARILDAVLACMDLPRLPDMDPLDQMGMVLSGRRALLVLDNFEQLVEGGAEVVARLLPRLPSLVLLVTSRRVLCLSFERAFPVAPLPIPPVPGPPDGGAPRILAQIPSVQLFVDRAQCARPDFQVTEGNARSVSAIVSRLEGIPLALELAAARCVVTPPSRMLPELEHRFDVLVSRYRDAEPRHRTMSAAIEWSYRLLSPELQRFFRRLSVFRGGWTGEAARDVCGEPRAGEYLEEMREASLVLVDEADRGVRFRMLETLREYAAEEMSEAEGWDARRSHRDHFLALTQQAGPELSGARQPEWFARLEAEHDNLRAALAFCREDPEGAEPGLVLAGTMGAFWLFRGYVREGWEHLRAAMAHPGASTGTAGWAMATVGATYLGWDDPDPALHNQRNLETAVAILRRSGPAWALVWALLRLGWSYGPTDLLRRRICEEALAMARQHHLAGFVVRSLDELGHVLRHCSRQGRVEASGEGQAAAIAVWEEALALARRTGDAVMQANLLCDVAVQYDSLGQSDRARDAVEEALSISEGLLSNRDRVWILLVVANLLREGGEYGRAEALYRDAEAISRSSGSISALIRTLDGLGGVARDLGDYPAARRYYEEQKALDDRRGPPDHPPLLANLGRLTATEGNLTAGRAMLLQALAIDRAAGDVAGEARNLLVLGDIARREGDFTEARRLLAGCLRLWTAAGPGTFIASALEAFARLAAAEGQPDRAARLYGAAEVLREAIRKAMPPADRPEHESAIAAARAAMGADAFAAAWAEGRAMSLETAVDGALGRSPGECVRGDAPGPCESAGPSRC